MLTPDIETLVFLMDDPSLFLPFKPSNIVPLQDGIIILGAVVRGTNTAQSNKQERSGESLDENFTQLSCNQQERRLCASDQTH